MAGNNIVADIIEKLTNGTRYRGYKWKLTQDTFVLGLDRLDGVKNKAIQNYINHNSTLHSNTVTVGLDLTSSYSLAINRGVISLLVYNQWESYNHAGTNLYVLTAQRRYNSSVVVLNSVQEFQTQLNELFQVILWGKDHDEVRRFLQDFLTYSGTN